MSLSSALSTAVSGLTAQSTALSNISKNISNASTTAYAETNTDFQTVLAGVTGTDVGGGVQASGVANLAGSGQINSTNIGTNLAIYQSGFFVVAPSATSPVSQYAYTRDGSFTRDKQGLLVNDQGYYLEGFPTNSQGQVTVTDTSNLSNLQPINIGNIGGTAKATTAISFTGNIPADAPINGAYTTNTSFYDSLGISHTVNQTWTKTGANTWTLDFANPTLSSDPSTPTGDTISPSSVTVTFDNTGLLQSVTDSSGTPLSPLNLSISGTGPGGELSTGASASTIAFNLGTPGKTDGATQYTSSSGTPAIGNPNFTQDGAVYGQLQAVTIDSAGLVTAAFDNGVKLPVYQIPLATFPNPNGLTPITGTVYSQNQSAGNVGLRMPGQGGAGTIESSALEGSSTDIAGEFNKMIVAQQAYSAASQVVSTVKSMFDTLSQSVR